MVKHGGIATPPAIAPVDSNDTPPSPGIDGPAVYRKAEPNKKQERRVIFANNDIWAAVKRGAAEKTKGNVSELVRLAIIAYLNLDADI